MVVCSRTEPQSPRSKFSLKGSGSTSSLQLLSPLRVEMIRFLVRRRASKMLMCRVTDLQRRQSAARGACRSARRPRNCGINPYPDPFQRPTQVCPPGEKTLRRIRADEMSLVQIGCVGICHRVNPLSPSRTSGRRTLAAPLQYDQCSSQVRLVRMLTVSLILQDKDGIIKLREAYKARKSQILSSENKQMPPPPPPETAVRFGEIFVSFSLYDLTLLQQRSRSATTFASAPRLSSVIMVDPALGNLLKL